ncbi:MAG: hypothetical protein HQL49_05095 [Gammaproteobacteria bacterium]|nr:hypothetical protein [Gammaproteobacteria bacterium]
MNLKVEFINIEENNRDLIVSFAISDSDNGVNSLILHRQLFLEFIMPDEERGVKVSYNDVPFEQEEFNMLNSVKITKSEISIKSTHREYTLNVSNLAANDIDHIVKLLKKQNYDNRFIIQID